MGTLHYSHLEQPIKDFFRRHGMDVAVEPRGSRGPDLESVSRTRNGSPACVGEIKHDAELQRDLRSAFWSNWNNPNQSFGGKPKGYVLRDAESLDRAVDGLSSPALGFVATVMGQLKFYVRNASLSAGWLVIENASRWRAPLSEALDALQRSNHAHQDPLEIDSHGIGYVCIHYL